MGILFLDIILAIFASISGKFNVFFTLPLEKSSVWIMVVKILIVDLTRVFAFGLLLKRDSHERRPRLFMGLARVGTLALHIFLTAFSYTVMGTRGQILKLILNILLMIADVYFSAVIFSYYRTTTQEEIEIELKRLG